MLDGITSVISFDYAYLCSPCEVEGGEEEERAEREGSSPMLVMWDSKAKGPQRRVYGRVPVELKMYPACSSQLVL